MMAYFSALLLAKQEAQLSLANRPTLVFPLTSDAQTCRVRHSAAD